MLVILFVILAQFCRSSSQSDFYDVPAYYGHFSRRYFDPNFILGATFARVEFHFAVDATYDNQTLYFAKPEDHCVYSYSVSSQTIQPFVGQCGFSGNAIGSKQLAKFNSISSVAYFKKPSQRLMTQLLAQKVLIVANSTCEISSCLLVSDYPQLNMDNLRYQSEVSLFVDQPSSQEFMYLADSANHCIKVLSFSENRVSVVAGKCGEAGFLDGPINYNRLNTPTNIGVSRKGVVYFFDSGNQYIRILDLSGNVQTLQLGACRQFSSGRVVQDYEFRQMLCYQNWIEGMTQSSKNHYFDPSILKICSSQSSQCAYQQ